MVVLDVGGRAGRDGALVQAPRLREIRNVEQRELRAEGLAPLGGVLADAQQQVAAHGVEVGRVAADLQLSAHPRGSRVGEVHGVEGIDLAEGHDVADVVDEAHGIDALALAESTHLAEPGEAVAPAGPAWSRSSDPRFRCRRARSEPRLLATRSTPPRSDIAHWLSRKPGTVPLAR